MPEDRQIEAVIQKILNGHADDRIGDIMDAINRRNEERKETVKRLVREVFGDDFDVGPRENPFIKRARERAEAGEGRQPGEILPGESPHVQPVDPFADDPVSLDDESRSPIFGARPPFE
jgi:hypothetical protein